MSDSGPPLAEVSFDVTSEDFIETHMRVMQRSPMVRQAHRRLVRNIAVSSVIALIMIGGLLYRSAPDPKNGVVRLAIWAVVWSVFVARYFIRNASWKSFCRTARLNYERFIRKGVVPLPPGPAKVTLSETSVTCSDGQTLMGFEWGKIEAVELDQGAICFDAVAGGIRVPAEAFTDADDSRRFFETSRELWQIHNPPGLEGGSGASSVTTIRAQR